MGIHHQEQEAGPPSKLSGVTWLMKGVLKEIACILCKYHDACLVNTNKISVCRLKITMRGVYHHHAINFLDPFSCSETVCLYAKTILCKTLRGN
jgi:hypothetical protein